MKKTFILGAGASYPYGFPLGSELKKEIADILTPGGSNHPFYRFVSRHLRKNPDTIRILSSKIQKSPLASIDQLLLNHAEIPEFIDVGKLFIAFIINSRENINKLMNVKYCWYSYLFNKILSLVRNYPSKLNELDLYIITFNYDRSFECFLLHAIINSFDVTPDYAKKLIDEFSNTHIIHIHGSIGKLESFPYEFIGERLFNRYNEMAENIRVFHEEDDVKIIEKISLVLSASKEVHFLGFGYLHENLNKLMFPSLSERRSNHPMDIKGSRFNITNLELEDINRYCQSTYQYDINFFLTKHINDNFDCYNYLRNCVIFYE
jgi:hypothetical protein